MYSIYYYVFSILSSSVAPVLFTIYSGDSMEYNIWTRDLSNRQCTSNARYALDRFGCAGGSCIQTTCDVYCTINVHIAAITIRSPTCFANHLLCTFSSGLTRYGYEDDRRKYVHFDATYRYTVLLILGNNDHRGTHGTRCNRITPGGVHIFSTVFRLRIETIS